MQHLYAKEHRFAHKKVCLIRNMHGGVDIKAQLDSYQIKLTADGKTAFVCCFNKNTGLICYDLRSF